MRYTVKAGDTLTAIATRYWTTVADIVSANGLTNPDFIRVGQVLTIPDNLSAGDKVRNALNNCLDAIENLPEFKTLSGLLEEE